MNRLYLLGAVALTQVAAYVDAGTTATKTLPANNYVQNTYTGSTDCFSSGTATTLGLNNIYYQYYSFPIAAVTVTYGSYINDDQTPAGAAFTTNAVTGCVHSHMYNWMAQPQVAATTATITDGIGDAVVAYGYVMTGSTLAACALGTVVTTTLFSTTSIFTGSRFQHAAGIYTAAASIAATTTTGYAKASMLQHYGLASMYTTAVTAQAWAPPGGTAALGVVFTVSTNAYYDFAQQQVFQGQTQFGRGGGSTSAPCGWWVFYANEMGLQDAAYLSTATPTTTWNLPTTATATVHMWTDNAVTNTIGAFVLAALGAALY